MLIRFARKMRLILTPMLHASQHEKKIQIPGQGRSSNNKSYRFNGLSMVADK